MDYSDYSDELQFKVFDLLKKGFDAENDQNQLQIKINYKGRVYRFTQTLT